MEVSGAGPARLVANPMRLSATPPEARRAPPRHGEHTIEVLQERLGLCENTLNDLRRYGVLA
jgi:crotonobetainyl-CoA:carnitine CoA-transferase CaiB-like acyl-CoA transferase